MNQLTQVCRVCLLGRATMRTIESTELQGIYEMLAQTQLIGADLPQAVCNICYSLLRRCQRLVEFVQESENMLKLMLLFGTTADTVAKKLNGRSPINLKRIETTFLSIPDTAVKTPCSGIKFEDDLTEINDLSPKEAFVTMIKEESSIEKEQLLSEEEKCIENAVIYIKQEQAEGKDHISENKETILIEKEILVKEDTEIDEKNKGKEEIALIGEQIALLKEKITKEKEQIAIEKEHKSKEKEKKAVEKEQMAIKQELIAEGEALEKEALESASFKEEIIDVDDIHIKGIDEKTTETNIPKGLINVSSVTILSELQRVLQQNSGLLPETIEMEADSTNFTSTYNCKVCERVLESEASRELHMRKHREDTPYACRLCRRAFTRQGHLDSHMKIHMSEKHLRCNICDRTFHHVSPLSVHMRTHTSERHLCCRKCKKRYKTIDSLRIHLKTHKKLSTVVITH